MAGTSFGPGAANTIVFDRGTNIKFAEQTDADTPIVAPLDYSRYTAAVNRASLTPASTLLTAGTIPVNVEQFPGTPGPFTITGSWTQDVVARRMELIFRQLFNAPTATITAADDSAGTATNYLAATSLTTAGIDTFTAQPSDDADGGPVQIEVTLSGTVTIGGNAISATNPLRVAICGEDQNGNPLVNVVRFTAVGDETTDSYFWKIDRVNIANMEVVAGASVALAGQAMRRRVEIQSSPTYRQTPGMTFEFVSGNVPNTIRNAYLNTFALNVTREAIATYTFGITGRDFLAGLNPICGGNELVRPGTTATGAYGDGAFTPIQSDQTPFPGTGATLSGQVGDTGDPVRLTQLEGVTLNFDNGTAYTNRIGSLYPGIAYNTQRTITLEFTTEFHKNDLDAFQAYLDGRTWNNVQLRLTRLAGSNEVVGFDFAKIQWSEFPPINIEGGDYMQLTLRGIGLPSSANATDAIKYIAYYEYIQGSDDLTLANLALRSLS